MSVDDREVQQGLKRLEQALAVQRSAIEATMASIVIEAAKDRVPVVTGELHDSLHTEGSLAIADAPYAAIVHDNPDSSGFGFMVRAIDDSDDALLDAIAQQLW